MRRGFIVIVMAWVLAAATPARAQAPEPGVGRSVWITMTDGTVHRGTILGEAPAVITLRVDGATRELTKSDVRRIETRDDVGDGVAKGAIGLGIVGAAGSGFLAYSTCEGGNCALYTVQVGLVGLAIGGAVGAISGGLIDAVIPGRKVLFERSTVTVVPVITGRSRFVAVQIRW